jgi:hypothetical protein
MNAMFPTTPEVATTIIQLRNIPLQPYVFKIKHLHPIFSIDLHKHLVLNQPTLQPFNWEHFKMFEYGVIDLQIKQEWIRLKCVHPLYQVQVVSGNVNVKVALAKPRK